MKDADGCPITFNDLDTNLLEKARVKIFDERSLEREYDRKLEDYSAMFMANLIWINRYAYGDVETVEALGDTEALANIALDYAETLIKVQEQRKNKTPP